MNHPFSKALLIIVLMTMHQVLYAQFQMGYPHSNVSTSIEAYDVAHTLEGVQILAVNNGRQDVIITDNNGVHVSDYSAAIGSDFSELDSKTMAASITGETSLAGCNFPNIRVLWFSSTGIVQAEQEYTINVDGYQQNVHSIYESEATGSWILMHALLENTNTSSGSTDNFYHAIIKAHISLPIVSWITQIGDRFPASSLPNFRDVNGKYGDMYPTQGGGVAFTGRLQDAAMVNNDRLLSALLLDGSGNTVWAKHYLSSESEDLEGTAIYELVESNNKSYFIAGMRGDGNAVLIRTDALGNFGWIRSYGTNSVEQDQVIIRGIRESDNDDMLIIGEHQTETTSIAFGARVAGWGSVPGGINSSFYYPDYLRCNDITRTTPGVIYASGQTREGSDPILPGLLRFNNDMSTNCSYPFDLGDFHTTMFLTQHTPKLLAHEAEVNNLFPYGLTNNNYSDQDNCCILDTPVLDPVYICDPSGVNIGPESSSFPKRANYLWVNGSTTNQITVDTPGDYDLMTFNSSGCWSVETYNVEESIIDIHISSYSMNTGACNGQINFSANVTGTPGTLTYSIANQSGVTVATGPVTSPTIVSGLCSGTHSITVFNDLGCSDIELVTFKQGDGYISGFDHSSVTIYPNPSRGLVKVQLEQQLESGSIVIRDMQGRVAQSATITASTGLDLDVSKLSGGTYFITIEDNETGSFTTQKLMILE